MNNQPTRQDFFNAMTTGLVFWINENTFRRWLFRILVLTFILLPAIRGRDMMGFAIALTAVCIFAMLEFNLGFIIGHQLAHEEHHPKGKQEPPLFITIHWKGGEKHGKTNKRPTINGGSNKRSSSSSSRKRERGA